MSHEQNRSNARRWSMTWLVRRTAFVGVAVLYCSIAVPGVGAGVAIGSGAGALAVVEDNVPQIADLAFVIETDTPRIAFMAAGGGVAPLAVAGVNGEPAWSPDGTRLAYEGPAIGRSGEDHIWVMSEDGRRVDITIDTPGEGHWQPTWSPDGTRIAFSANSPEGCSHNDIWVMGADGANPRNLTNTPSCSDYDNAPDWSPDGQRIAFVSGRSGRPGMWSMNVTGHDARYLAEGTSPSFSPDGSRIAFVRGCDLWMMSADGGAQQLVKEFGDIDLCAGGPDWSPDGTRIAVAALDLDDHMGAEIYAVSVDDGAMSRLTNNRVPDKHPNWRPVKGAPLPPPASVGLVDSATGEWHLRSSTGAVTSFFYGNPEDVPFVGDWDCDGIATPGLFRTSDAFAYLRNGNSQGIADIRFFFGNPSDVPLAGDWDGDDCDTLSIYRPAEQRFYIINELGEDEGGLGRADYSFVFGDPGDKPVVGDWDGDGIDEVGLHRESTGFFYWRNTLTTGVADGEIFFGDPGDRFVSGDWGVVDGKDTPALFRPSDVTFYFRHTLTQGVADSSFAWTGAGSSWLPVSGRFSLPGVV